MSSKIHRIVAIVILASAAVFVATVLTRTRAEESETTAVPKVTEEAKKPAPGQGTDALEKQMAALERKLDTLEKNQKQILAELQQIRQTQDQILQMTQKIFIYMKRR